MTAQTQVLRRALAIGARALHTGRATPAGTARALAGRASRELRRTGGLRVSRVGFGLDDAGCVPPAERLDRLAALAIRQSTSPRESGGGGGGGGGGSASVAPATNFVVFDADAIAAARAAGAPVWERAALDRILGGNGNGGGGGGGGGSGGAAGGGVGAREGLVIALHLPAGAAAAGSAADAPPAAARVREALAALDLEQFDLVIAQVPAWPSPSPASLTPQAPTPAPASAASNAPAPASRGARLTELARSLEGVVGAGLSQFYGLSIDSLGGVVAGASASDEAAGASAAAAFRTVDLLLSSLGRVRGAAAAARAAAAADAGAGESAPSTSPLSQPASHHHCALVVYPASLLRLEPFLQRQPSSGAAASSSAAGAGAGAGAGASAGAAADARSVAQLLSDAGLTHFVRAPLDCVVRGRPFRCAGGLPSVGAIAAPAAGAGAGAGVVAGPSATARVAELFGGANHPRRLAARLSAAINAAVHLEEVWERGVRAAALASPLAAPSGQFGAVFGGGDAGGSGIGAGAADADATADDGPAAQLSRLDPRSTQWARALAAALSEGAAGAGAGIAELQWRFVRQQRLGPAVERVCRLARRLEASRSWAGAYGLAMAELAAAVDVHAAQLQAQRAAAVADALDAAAPELGRVGAGDGSGGGGGGSGSSSAGLARRALALVLGRGGADGCFSEVREAHAAAAAAAAAPGVEAAAAAAVTATAARLRAAAPALEALMAGGAAPPPRDEWLS